jgi:hypothetical protein
MTHKVLYPVELSDLLAIHRALCQTPHKTDRVTAAIAKIDVALLRYVDALRDPEERTEP